jgi:hypothetical protein
MKRFQCAYALVAAAVAVLGVPQASHAQSNPYEGTSNPPANDQIITSTPPAAKPPAGHRAVALPSQPVPETAAQEPQPAVDQPLDGARQVIVYPQSNGANTNGTNQDMASPAMPQAGGSNPNAYNSSANSSSANYDGTDSGTVQIAPAEQPAMNGSPQSDQNYAYDPDGDIVHPRPAGPGELVEGTTIRVRLLDRLSTAETEKGEPFRTRLASDVLQGGQVLIPAGAEIDGHVVEVSSGHAGGRGSMRLRPETVILPDGSRYRLYAELTGTPGSRTHIGSEGTVLPDSRLKRDGIEYGGAVGAGAVTGAILGGPVGALTGTAIGAGVITAHLLFNHPQATLDAGTVLLFTLTEPLNLVPAGVAGN